MVESSFTIPSVIRSTTGDKLDTYLSEIPQTTKSIGPTLEAAISSNLGGRTKELNAPAAIPKAKAIKSSHIDIVEDYPWTYSERRPGPNSDSLIPYITLREFKIVKNTLISSLLNSMSLIPDQVKNIGAVVGKVTNLFGDNKFTDFIKTSGVANKASELTNKTTKLLEDAIGSVAKFASNTKSDEWSGSGLDAYKYLYLRESTGNRYTFPFFSTSHFEFANTFTDTYSNKENGFFAKSIEALTQSIDAAATALDFTTITAPGMYIQRPKHYNFDTNAPSFDVSFYLYNTIAPEDFQKNLRFIYKLILQNQPHRKNRLLIDPPCIYEVTIPGRGFYPYVAISKIGIDHVGTKRVITATDGVGVSRAIIVPDAFKIVLKLESLVSDIANLTMQEWMTPEIKFQNEIVDRQIAMDKKNADDRSYNEADEGVKRMKLLKGDDPSAPLVIPPQPTPINKPEEIKYNSSGVTEFVS